MAEPVLRINTTLFVDGRNPELRDWPEDEKLARASLLLEVIEAATAEAHRAAPGAAWNPFAIAMQVQAAREWLETQPK